MNEEKMKMASEMAAKISDSILSECQPEAQGVVISLIMKNIHTTHRTRIAESETRQLADTEDYTLFMKNIDLPQIKDV